MKVKIKGFKVVERSSGHIAIKVGHEIFDLEVNEVDEVIKGKGLFTEDEKIKIFNLSGLEVA